MQTLTDSHCNALDVVMSEESTFSTCFLFFTAKKDEKQVLHEGGITVGMNPISKRTK